MRAKHQPGKVDLTDDWTAVAQTAAAAASHWEMARLHGIMQPHQADGDSPHPAATNPTLLQVVHTRRSQASSLQL